MNTLKELIEENLKDIHNAEKQLIKGMPKLAKMAQNPKLKEALENHMEETEEQVTRLEECMKELGIKPGGVICKGMQGIIEEMNEHLKEAKAGPVADAMIAGLAQKGEHYEICAYGTLFEYMKAAGMNDAVKMLKPNMAEEEKADKLLSQLGESELNQAAAAVQDEDEEKPKSTAKKADSKSESGRASAR